MQTCGGRRCACKTKATAKPKREVSKDTKVTNSEGSQQFKETTSGEPTSSGNKVSKACKPKRPRQVVRRVVSGRKEMYHGHGVGCQSGLQMGTRQDVACRQPFSPNTSTLHEWTRPICRANWHPLGERDTKTEQQDTDEHNQDHEKTEQKAGRHVGSSHVNGRRRQSEDVKAKSTKATGRGAELGGKRWAREPAERKGVCVLLSTAAVPEAQR